MGTLITRQDPEGANSVFRLIMCALLSCSAQLGAFDAVANDAMRQSPAGRASIVGPDRAALIRKSPLAHATALAHRRTVNSSPPRLNQSGYKIDSWAPP